MGSDSLNEKQLFDLATNNFRPDMATVPAGQIPYPYGGKQRQIMIDIDPEKLYAWKLSAADVSNAINAPGPGRWSTPPKSATRNTTSG